MRIASLLTFAVVAAASSSAVAQPVPAAIYTDPPSDAAHPAKMTVVHIPTHGLLINGLVYQPSGAGLHPTVVICHGLPGNEENLDLAQALRRAGWNAVTFNYRGSWGSPGNFRFAQNLEDSRAVLAYLRDPANAALLGIDTHRVVLAGHSMGGWVVAHTAASDKGLTGAIMISVANMGRIGDEPRDRVLALMAGDLESLAGVTAESMADELRHSAKAFRMENTAAGLSQIPLLVLTSDDGYGPDANTLVGAIEAKGGRKVTAKHFATDHVWSDRRITLESEIIKWLTELHDEGH